jgi:Domain of unknown function (DUF4381)
MNPELQQLKDIHLPHAINMWPVAPGWIMLFALVLSLFFYLSYFGYQRYKRKKTVKFALAKLKELKLLNIENPQNINIAVEISTLIRRTALHYFRREEIAGLSGNEWLNFLNHSGNTTQFTDETGRLLIDAPYRKNNTADLMPLLDSTQAWLVAIAKKNTLPAEK